MKSTGIFRELIDKYYSDAIEAQERGEKIGYCSSNFPVEIPEVLGLHVVFPENHSATLANSEEGSKYISVSEDKGYSNDLCSYARINLGYSESFDSEIRNLPRPDFILCSTNTCHQLIKWFEILSQKFNVPMFTIDIPMCLDGEADEDTLSYVKAQIHECINSLAEYTGKTFSQEKFDETLRITSENGKKWRHIQKMIRECNPSPVNGFDLFTMMSLSVCYRSKKESLDFFNAYEAEIQEKIQKGKNPVKNECKVHFEGIACWPYLFEMQVPLLERGLNPVSTTYTNVFSLEYEGEDEMVKAYCKIPNALSMEKGVQLREKLIRESDAKGAVFNISRSCRIWCGNYYEMEREISDRMMIPTVLFDGDQADKKNFSYAQYDTRIEAFSEILKEFR